jgi:hypothetical protein
MTTDQLTLFVSLFIPIVVSFIKREHFPNAWNAIIALVVYVVAGIAAVIVSGQPFLLTNIVPSVSLFVIGGTAAYQLFWKNLETSGP